MEPPAALLVVDDRQGDAVLDAAAGIQVLALGEDGHGEPEADAAERNQRGAADGLEDQRMRTAITVTSSSGFPPPP